MVAPSARFASQSRGSLVAVRSASLVSLDGRLLCGVEHVRTAGHGASHGLVILCRVVHYLLRCDWSLHRGPRRRQADASSTQSMCGFRSLFRTQDGCGRWLSSDSATFRNANRQLDWLIEDGGQRVTMCFLQVEARLHQSSAASDRRGCLPEPSRAFAICPRRFPFCAERGEYLATLGLAHGVRWAT